jgi:hypothetical protein
MIFSARPTGLSSFPAEASIYQNSSTNHYNLQTHSHQEIAKISSSSKVKAGARFGYGYLHIGIRHYYYYYSLPLCY